MSYHYKVPCVAPSMKCCNSALPLLLPNSKLQAATSTTQKSVEHDYLPSAVKISHERRTYELEA